MKHVNDSLERDISELLAPPGGKPLIFYKGFL